jgi:hypothetical protein
VRPATDPTALAISAMGATVPYPAVVVVRAGNVEVCPLATPCTAWINLGALGTTINMDGTHLYVGTATGLQRCALSEIGTVGTCTLAAFGPNEAVNAPLYLTSTAAWYRSGTRVQRIIK